MTTQAQPIYSVPVQPIARQEKAGITQRQLAAVLQMRQQPTQFDEPLDKAEDKITYALQLGCEIEPGPLTAWEQTWEDTRYSGNFAHLVVVNSAAAKDERKSQALYWTPGAWPFPKRVQRVLEQAVA